MNKTRKVNEEKLKIETESPKRKVQFLHIDADKDHVALQDGKNAIADIRIYCQNGGKITPNHFTKAKQQYKIKQETIKKAKEVFSKTTYRS